jgi:hypothetical protein
MHSSLSATASNFRPCCEQQHHRHFIVYSVTTSASLIDCIVVLLTHADTTLLFETLLHFIISHRPPVMSELQPSAQRAANELADSRHPHPLFGGATFDVVLSFVGRRHWAFVAPVCKPWCSAYAQLKVPRQNAHGRIECDSSAKLTCYKAACASAACLTYALASGLDPNDAQLQLIAGWKGDLAALQAAHEAGMPLTTEVACGAATSCSLPKLEWLEGTADQRLAWHHLGEYAVISGGAAIVQWCAARGAYFDYDAVYNAAHYGHTAVVQYLLAQQCSVHERAYVVAAEAGSVPLLDIFAATGCELNLQRPRVLLTAVSRGHEAVLDWVRARGGELTSFTMEVAAKYGQTGMCIYLRSLDCPWAAEACCVAAENGHLATLQWLCDNGCPYQPAELTKAAEENGGADIIDYVARKTRA